MNSELYFALIPLTLVVVALYRVHVFKREQEQTARCDRGLRLIMEREQLEREIEEGR